MVQSKSLTTIELTKEELSAVQTTVCLLEQLTQISQGCTYYNRYLENQQNETLYALSLKKAQKVLEQIAESPLEMKEYEEV